MFHRGINTSINLCPKRFSICRGVCQGCLISPFLFLIVVEFLSIKVLNSPNIQGITVFNKQIRLTQLADDTVLFLKNKEQLPAALQIVNTFSVASGLMLNVMKCEIMCLYESNETFLCNITVKNKIQ